MSSILAKILLCKGHLVEDKVVLAHSCTHWCKSCISLLLTNVTYAQQAFLIHLEEEPTPGGSPIQLCLLDCDYLECKSDALPHAFTLLMPRKFALHCW